MLSKLPKIYPYFRLMASWAPPSLIRCHLLSILFVSNMDILLTNMSTVAYSNRAIVSQLCALRCLAKPETSSSSYLCNKAEKIKNLSLCWNLSPTTMAQNSFQDWRFLYLFFQTFFSGQENKRRYIQYKCAFPRNCLSFSCTLAELCSARPDIQI